MNVDITIKRAANELVHQNLMYKKDAEVVARQLREQGFGPSIKSLTDEIWEERNRQSRIRTLKKNRDRNRSRLKLQRESRIMENLLTVASVRERLCIWRKSTFRDHVDFRIALAGDHNEKIILTDDPWEVMAEGESYTSLESGHRYSTTHSKFKFVIPRHWISRVYKRGLANIDGLLTLDAQPVHVPERDLEAFAAKWVGQSRGFSLRTDSGFIIRHPETGTTYHSHSLQSGRNTIRRKIREQLEPERIAKERAERLEGWLRKVERESGSQPVTMADARATGACEYGIRSWCHSVGLNPDANFVFLSDIIEGYRQRPQQEALTIIRRMEKKF